MAAWPNLGTRKRGDQPLAQQGLEHPDDPRVPSAAIAELLSIHGPLRPCLQPHLAQLLELLGSVDCLLQELGKHPPFLLGCHWEFGPRYCDIDRVQG